MKIPRDAKLQGWAKEIADECQVSMARRREQARMWRQLFFTGTTTAKPSKHNKCFSTVDKLASFLFSPAEVRFSIDMEADQQPEFGDCADAAARHLNQEFARGNCGLSMGAAVELALIDGSSFVKPAWKWLNRQKGIGRVVPHVIRQGFMGVLREDQSDFSEQEAFTHSQYLTPSAFNRLIRGHPDEAELKKRAQASVQPPSDDMMQDSYLREIVSGGLQPISITGTPTGAYGNVQVFASAPSPLLASEVASELIRIDDLWVWDDDMSDWVTIRMCEPGIIIEGKTRLQNLGDVPGQHPFVKVCPNEINGYFWGRSELANVAALQEILNGRINDIDDIFRLNAKPPRSFSGFGAITSEKALALLAAGGTLTEEAPLGAKVENLAPPMPPMALDYIVMLERFFDEAAGFSAILSGEGEAGVRAGAQAQTLIRTASPRMRDRSLIVEAQCAEFGQKCLNMIQAKNARVFKTEKKRDFTLAQLPTEARVVVDSHTSSPAFQGDYLNLAFALAKAGAVDTPDLIAMTHPPFEDRLIDKAKTREAAQAELMKANPELAKEMSKGKGR